VPSVVVFNGTPLKVQLPTEALFGIRFDLVYTIVDVYGVISLWFSETPQLLGRTIGGTVSRGQKD
jgi:hypothetical protein